MERFQWSAAQCRDVWCRWRRGESQYAIARAMGCSRPTVSRLVRRTGGVMPVERRRAARTLSLAEREEISRGLVAGESYRTLGRRLGRAASTICREVRRHAGPRHYRAAVADTAAWAAACRPKRCLLAQRPSLARRVARCLAAKWSPEQIAAWLTRTYPDDRGQHVSHETIYRTLFVQTRGVFKQEMVRHLRRGRVARRARITHAVPIGPLADAISIRERPASADDRAVPGHWEGDLLTGTIHSQIATLVERRSRYVMLVRVPTKEATVVARALAQRIGTLPRTLRQTLTWDRGREMAGHKAFTIASDVQVYFCDPHSPWQRGSNENTNGLLRQYFPRGTDLTAYTQAHLDRVAHELNQRPRKTLGFRTPADILAETVAMTG
jgi:IS30 family transposase